MKRKLLLLLSIFGLVSQAQNIFKDDLLPYIVSSPLHSQGLWSHANDAANGGFGAGACNPVVSGQPCFSANVLFNSVSYTNYGSSVTSLELAPFLDNPGHPINPKVTDGDIYVGMVLNLATAPVAGVASDFFRAANSDTSLITFRLIVQDAGTGYKIGIKKGPLASPTVYSDNIYSYNQNNLVILKYSHLSGTNDDVLNLYVNADYAAGEPVAPTATTSTGFDQSGNIDRVFFRLGFNTVGSIPTGVAGLISASKTWTGLGFVPLSVDEFNNSNFTLASSQASKGLLSIKSDIAISKATLNIYTITGQLIENKFISLEANNNDISINPIRSSSVYIVELITENGSKITKKITIN